MPPWGELERPWDSPDDDPDQPDRGAPEPPKMRREQSRGLLDTPDTNNIGRSEVISLGGGVRTLVNLKDGTDDRAMVMSVCFAELTPEGTPVRTPIVDPVAVAIVEWGTGGLQSSAEVDFIKGTVINVVAAFIRVGARHESAAPGDPGDRDLRAGAFVSYLPSRSVIAPKRTLRQLTGLPIAGGTLSAVFTIPNFSGRVTLLRVPVTAAFVIRLLNQAGAIIAESALPDVEIPNDARFVQVLAVADITQLRLVFHLFL